MLISRRTTFVLTATIGLVGACCQADVIVATSSGKFGRMSLETGAFTQVAINRWYVGMGWNERGELLGLRSITTPTLTTSYLDRIVPSTGARTIHAQTEISVNLRRGSTAGGVGFCVTPDGTVYGAEYQTIDPYTQTRVATIDPTNGALSEVGGLGFSFNGALATDSSGRIWGVRGSYARDFFQMDRSTGQTRIVASNTGFPIVYSMVFERGVLYAFDVNGGINAVNRETGAMTRVATFNQAASGFIYAAASSSPPCAADVNGDGFVDFFDYDAFVEAFESGGFAADHNADGFIDFFDYSDFVNAFEAGC